MGQRTILLAEGDPEHVELIRNALKRVTGQCRLDVVDSGVGVIEYLFATGPHAGRKRREPPSLILLGLQMPRMDGLQVLQVLRRVRSDQRGKLPPVVILASSSEETDVLEAYRLGAHSFIRKPAEFPRLVETLGKIVGYWLELNELPPARRSYAKAVALSAAGN